MKVWKRVIFNLKRIGPHNKDILDIFVGSLLGKGYAEKRGLGIRLILQQEESNREYLQWFFNNISKKGYCSENVPKMYTKIEKKGKKRYILRVRTYTYNNLLFLYDMFYKDNYKYINPDIETFLTPLSLAIWFIDVGTKSSSGFKFCTNSFKLQEVEILCNILNSKFSLNSCILSAGFPNQYVLFIPKSSKDFFLNLLSPYILPSMKYKFL